MPARAYLPYLLLGESAAGLGCLLASVLLLTNLLYRLHLSRRHRLGRRRWRSRFSSSAAMRTTPTTTTMTKKRERGAALSSSMCVFLWFHLANCLACWPLELYRVALWEAPAPTHVRRYSIYALFWLGSASANYLAVAPANLFFLTLDRCLTLKWAVHYGEAAKRVYTAASVMALAAIYALSECFFLLELPLDERATATCEDFPCTVPKYHILPQLTIKIVFATLNLFCITYFFILIRKHQYSINDRVIKMTVISEVFLSIIPGYFSFFFNIIVGESSANYFGGYTWLFVTLDCLLCALYYSYVLLWRRESSTAKMPTRVTFVSDGGVGSGTEGIPPNRRSIASNRFIVDEGGERMH